MISKDETKSHIWSDWPETKSDQSHAFTEVGRTNSEQARNVARSCKTLLRVAATQLPRLSAARDPDEADPVATLRPYVEREIDQTTRSADHHSLGTVSQVNHD